MWLIITTETPSRTLHHSSHWLHWCTQLIYLGALPLNFSQHGCVSLRHNLLFSVSIRNVDGLTIKALAILWPHPLQWLQCIALNILSYVSHGNWASQSFRKAYLWPFYVHLALAPSLILSLVLGQGYCLASYQGQGRQDGWIPLLMVQGLGWNFQSWGWGYV